MKASWQILAVVALAAILGLFIPEAFVNAPETSDSAALRGSTHSRLNPLPLLAEALVPLNSPSLRPCLSGNAETTADRASEAIVGSRTPATVGCQSLMIAALILAKYQPFRESLRTP